VHDIGPPFDLSVHRSRVGGPDHLPVRRREDRDAAISVTASSRLVLTWGKYRRSMSATTSSRVRWLDGSLREDARIIAATVWSERLSISCTRRAQSGPGTFARPRRGTRCGIAATSPLWLSEKQLDFLQATGPTISPRISR
jgi:hypothetical protein